MTEQRPSPEQRYDHGVSLRQATPLDSHGEWSARQDRVDPVTLIEEQNADRLGWLVPERRARMSRSPFTFFRGAARIMAADLSDTPVSGLPAQICGDAHLANFGAYASPERQMVFDLNDFDETLPGPWEWDVKRLAASMYIAGCHNGLDEKRTRKITRRTVAAYRKAMAEFASMRLTDLWYDVFPVKRVHKFLKGTKHYQVEQKRVEKFKKKDSRHVLDQLAEKVDGQYRIRSAPPLLIPLRDLTEESDCDLMPNWVAEAFEEYRKSVTDELKHLLDRFRIVDYALKVVGVGSVGTRCGILLLEGRDQQDPLFLQIKQAGKSVLEEYLSPSCYTNSAERVIQGQRLMQAANDIFLGWNASRFTGHHFYWRQLKDWKGSIDVDNVDFAQLNFMARIRGFNLGRAHARSGDACAISGYLDDGKRFDRAITEFAARYTAQNQRDYQAYMAEIRGGRLEVSDSQAASDHSSGS